MDANATDQAGGCRPETVDDRENKRGRTVEKGAVAGRSLSIYVVLATTIAS